MINFLNTVGKVAYVLSPYELRRVRMAGHIPPGRSDSGGTAVFTVTDTAITGGTDGQLAKLLVGGPAKLRRLKKLGIRA